MNSDSQNKQKLFLKYLNGNLSENEELSLTEWIKYSNSNLDQFNKFISNNQFSQISTDKTNKAWGRIKSRLYINPKQTSTKKFVINNWLKIAAVVVIAFISGFLLNSIYQIRNENYAINEVIVSKGEKSQIVLSDGSKVFLNSQSQFKYPANFSKKNRKVILSGEAFFNVEKDLSKPFIVETPEYNVWVTGTSFNLSAYEDDKESILTLHSGSVFIEKNGENFKINPGQKYIFNKVSHKSKIIKTNIEKSALWKEDIIVIEDMVLTDIKKILEREFNINIQIVSDELMNIRYTGQFKAHETLEEILMLIKDASPIKFKVEFSKTKDYVSLSK